MNFLIKEALISYIILLLRNYGKSIECVKSGKAKKSDLLLVIEKCRKLIKDLNLILLNKLMSHYII